MEPSLPSGTVTFLFTDIEGSTRLWERHPEAMKTALARHDELLRRVVTTHHGRVVKSTGDGAYAVFAAATDAALTAIDFQRGLAADPWPELAPDSLRARAGCHTGEAELREGDYFGPTLNRTARIMSIGHGGQILLSAATAALVRDMLPAESTLCDLGQHRLSGLSRVEGIYQLVAPGLPDQFPPLKSFSARIVSLPQPPTGFIGRRNEVDDILDLLDRSDARLVSLIGPGGMGKTRLAIQAAATLNERDPDRFPAGICFVPLAPESKTEGIITAIAAALGFQFSRSEDEPARQLSTYLLSRAVLLVLDNMEQLLAAGGGAVVASILDAAPDVRLLVTSRSRVGIQGEYVYHVPGMRLPDPATVAGWAEPDAQAEQYSGLCLFRQSAGRVQPGFRLTRRNIADVTRIGRQVQGMPLGIELAAGWLELLSPAEIAAEIDRSLDVLATDLHGVPDRQRSLRAVFDTTWTLLSDQERELLPALAVFRAPFTREAAAAVAGATLPDLLALANKSWLQRATDSDGTSRFLTHELLRQYAEEILRRSDKAALIDSRFARYYAQLVADSKHRLLGDGQKEALSGLTAEFDHIRIAWDWLVAHNEFDIVIDQMLRPLHRFGAMRGTFPVNRLIRQAIEAWRREDVHCPHHVLAALWVSHAGLIYGDSSIHASLGEAWRLRTGLETPEWDRGIWYVYRLAHRLHHDPAIVDKLLELAETEEDDAAGEALRLAGIGLAIDPGNRPAVEESVVTLRRAGSRYERRGDAWGFAQVCQYLSNSLAMLDRYTEASATLDRAQDIYESLEDWRHVMELAFQRSAFALGAGRPDLAHEVWETAIDISRKYADRHMEALMLGRHSIDVVRFGNIDYARQLRERSLVIIRDLEMTDHEPWGLWELGEIHRVAESTDEARRYYEESRPLFKDLDDGIGLAYHRRGLGDLALMAGDFAAAAAHFIAAGKFLAGYPNQPWSRVYMTNGLARALLGLARPEEALAQLEIALPLTRGHELLTLQPLLLVTCSELALAADRPRPAAVWCGLLAVHPLTWNETRRHVATLANRARAALGPEAADAEARGRTLDIGALFAGLSSIAQNEPAAWLDAALQLTYSPLTLVENPVMD